MTMTEPRHHLIHRGSGFSWLSSTLPSMFGGCDEDDIVSMTQDLALSEGYDVAVFVQVKGLELGTSASGLTL